MPSTGVADRWRLDIDEKHGPPSYADPSVALVRHAMVADTSERAAPSFSPWHDDVVWRIPGTTAFSETWAGRDGILAYRRLLARLSDDTIRQRLISLEGSQSAMVAAYLRTTAVRRGRRLDIPTLLNFELGEGRIRTVTELPGDRAAWDRFWSD